MNSDQMAGKWKQTAGKVKEKWGKLTDDDLTVIDGKKEQLVGRIQERYGIAKEAAEKQVDEFNRTLNEADRTAAKAARFRALTHIASASAGTDAEHLFGK